jgi:hypothetical protein
MKKMIIMMMMGIFLLASVSAELNFWQQTFNQSDIQREYATISYDADVDDFVSAENPLELYVWYDIYIDEWNTLNPDYPVDYCNFSVGQATGVSNVSVVFSRLISGDYRDAKYFVRMNDDDFVSVTMDCHFNSTNISYYIFPASFQIVTPTWECKECQYYEWSLIERDITKAENIGEKQVSIVDNMYNVIFLNFEIWLALFWIVLIVVAVHSTGLLFIGLIWLFAYLKNLIT